ncbi:MAG TPA: hypothetical protein VMU84_19515 [Thermoanaerobaculia bacterium]|nr:hypothetical protein [Thermoanaerobaculia bacterium]
MPTESTTTHLLETIGVIAAGAAIAAVIASRGGYFVILVLVAIVFLWLGLHLRTRRAERNELDLREILYSFPPDRAETLKLVFPLDVVDAVASLNGIPTLRLEIKRKLNARIGEARANEYMPIILRYADQERVKRA